MFSLQHVINKQQALSNKYTIKLLVKLYHISTQSSSVFWKNHKNAKHDKMSQYHELVAKCER